MFRKSYIEGHEKPSMALAFLFSKYRKKNRKKPLPQAELNTTLAFGRRNCFGPKSNLSLRKTGDHFSSLIAAQTSCITVLAEDSRNATFEKFYTIYCEVLRRKSKIERGEGKTGGPLLFPDVGGCIDRQVL